MEPVPPEADERAEGKQIRNNIERAQIHATMKFPATRGPNGGDVVLHCGFLNYDRRFYIRTNNPAQKANDRTVTKTVV
jgi:hypothetical protein